MNPVLGVFLFVMLAALTLAAFVFVAVSVSSRGGERGMACNQPPKGWYCTRGTHSGPCAAWPTRWTRFKIWLSNQGDPE